MRYRDIPLELKALNDDGSFSGYASVFGNVDLDGDVIERGAFKEIIRNEDGKVVVLWQHNQREPIGVADVSQDAKGLKFEGALVLEDPTARKARAHMLAKSVRGMSIGFDTMLDEIREGVRHILEARLWEISIVTLGANPLAGVDEAKSIPNVRECEEYLRDVGFSRSKAKAMAAAWDRTINQREVGEVDADLKALDWSFLKSFSMEST